MDGITDAKGMNLEQTPRNGDGQGSLVRCSREESDTAWRLDNHHHLTLVRMDTIKKSTNYKCRRACGEKGTFLHYWWGQKLAQPQWKTVWRVLRKLKTLPYDPETPLLGINPDKTIIQKDTCTPTFTALNRSTDF